LIMSNPFRSKLSFMVKSPADEQVAVKLINLSGVSVHESLEVSNKNIDVEKPIASGLYILHVKTKDNFKALRVIKVD
jgi:hypothetical protein